METFIGKKFIEYVKAHPMLNVTVGVVLALCYAKQAYSTVYYIDAEAIINYPGEFYNWLDIGRFGLVFLKKLLGLAWYNPYLEAGLFLLALWAAALGLGFWFYLMDSRIHYMAALIPLVALVHPNYAEQFMFRFQAFEMAAAVLLLLAAQILLVLFIRERNVPAFALAVICSVLAFGVYQSMVNLSLTLCMGGFLALTYASGEDRKCLGRSIAGYAGHFLLSFILYQVLVLLFFSRGDYLSGKTGWQDGLSNVLPRLRDYVYWTVKGSGPLYTASYVICIGILCIALAALAARRGIRGIWYVLGGIGLAASPFYLSAATGTATEGRAQLMLPFTCSLILLFAVQCLSELKRRRGYQWGTALCMLLALVCLYQQASPLMRLFYTEDVVRHADEITAVRIIDELEDILSVHGGKPIIFAGHRAGLRSDSAYPEDQELYLCRSVFEFDYSSEPEYYNSTLRILGYFRTMGYRYGTPSSEMMPDAYEAAREMVCWPLPGSIQEFDDFVLVKLSD